MQTNNIYKIAITALITCLLSACIGTSQSLTEEEKENLALLKAVNGKTPIKKNTDKSIKVSLLDAHQVEEKPHMTFKLVLNKAASQDISVSINLDTSFTHIDAQAKQNTDFSLPNLSAVTIPAGQTETQFKVEVIDDDLIEATEQFKLIASNLNVTDGSVKLLKDSATGTILDNERWRKTLNSRSPQLVKLDADGNELDITATTWSCVKDNRTGLIWEVKTATAKSTKAPYIYNPEYLHDKIWFYSSFDLRYLDGEYEGKLLGDYGVQKEDLTQEQLYGKDMVYAGKIDIPVYNRDGGDPWSNGSNACSNKQWVCTTHQYTLDVNQGKGLCGFRDWRMPTVMEVETIFNHNGTGQDTQFFPHKIHIWTKTPATHPYERPITGVIRYTNYKSDKQIRLSSSSRLSFVYKPTSIRLVRSQPVNNYTPATHQYSNTPTPAHSTQTYKLAIPFNTPTSDFEFIPNIHGVLDTVKHLTTGLVWKRCPEQFELNNQGTKKPKDDTCNYTGTNPYTRPNWQDVLGNVPTGWRIPNIKELASIAEYSATRPSINLVVFPDHFTSYCFVKNGISKMRKDSLTSSTPKTDDSNYAYSFFSVAINSQKHNPKVQNTSIVDGVVKKTYDPKRCHFTRLVKDN